MAKKNNTPLTNQQLNRISGLLGVNNDWLEKIYNAIISNKNSNPNGNGGNKKSNGGGDDDDEEDDEEKNGNKVVAALYEVIKKIGGLVVDASNKWMEIEDRVKKVGRSIGLSHEQVRGYQQDIMNNYGQMAAKLGMTIDELTQFQEKYTKATGRAIQLSKEEVHTLASASKLVGEVATNKIVENMDNFGSSTKTATSYLALNMARAKATGLDAQKASEAFADNVKMASKYTFKEGVNGISKMTLLSQQLKFNMESIGNAAEKFQTIEGAIQTSANLQMLGGSFAAQFSNPLEAMNASLLSIEDFTTKVIDSVKGKATFNTKTGQIEMSAIDKQFLKHAAQNLGVSYDDLFNMASQPTKIREIERRLDSTQNFTKEEKAFISNKAQYDPETGTFKLTYFDTQGNEQQADVSKISKQQLRQIQQQHDVEKAIYGDVHSIHGMLQDYLKEQGYEYASMKEHLKGIGEASATSMANVADTWMNTLSDWTKGFASWENVGDITATAVALGGIVNAASKPFMKDIGDFAKGKFGGMFGGGGSGGGSGGGGFGGGLGNMGKKLWGGVKTVAKSKGLARGLGGLGVAISAIDSISTISESEKLYDEKIKEIERSSLSEEEKAKAIYNAKKESNETNGGAIGSTVGGTIGAALGSFIPIPVVGTMLGGAIGSWIGEHAGTWIGGAITSDEGVENSTPTNNEVAYASPMVNDNNSPYINYNDNEMLAINHIRDGVDSINGYLSVLVRENNKYLSGGYGDSVRTTNYNNNSVFANGQNYNDVVSISNIGAETYIRPIHYSNNLQDQNIIRTLNDNLNVNFSGSIKLISDNSSVNFDAKQLLNDEIFIKQLKDIIMDRFTTVNGITADAGSLTNITKMVDSNVNYGTSRKL